MGLCRYRGERSQRVDFAARKGPEGMDQSRARHNRASVAGLAGLRFPGELLFLPIGCLHHVEGVDVSVTVSFANFVFDGDFASFDSTEHQV